MDDELKKRIAVFRYGVIADIVGGSVHGRGEKKRLIRDKCASIGIALINSRPYQPEGKGKIERWFRTVRECFLSTADAKTLDKLNDLLNDWVASCNHTRHSITKEEPIKRFISHIECIRAASGDMEDHFRRVSGRTVSKDRTVRGVLRISERTLCTGYTSKGHDKKRIGNRGKEAV